jgi:hypothetical protein
MASSRLYVILICVLLLLFQQGPVASQPLSVSIPQERSITPVVQDFTDPNMFYLPAYYYGGEGPSRNYYRDHAIISSAIYGFLLCILLYADMFFLVPVFQVTMEP